ncbi:MAG: hypothetical protein CVU42_07110 [Chloroflexi bacterium HGW-Chloroflexi-4]|jgi:hemerythrin-like metal-binding protein|nr:MAG: hypothetical protein CVU45_03170 [Chloroflexi bacterium HGW-Chloroflexi-7]PKN99750.1 MAG: hypothetical protein CVU42_07110 [Chloroflexi bacterium HGW-Chloroflexi-4]
MTREIVWNEEYSVGVNILDRQHQTIINVLNKLFIIYDTTTEAKDLVTILNELIDYANLHFTTEETLLEKYHYRDLIVQRNEHSIYQQKINKFIDRIANEEHQVMSEATGFLVDWWMGHIQGSDKDYTRFLNNNGVF